MRVTTNNNIINLIFTIMKEESKYYILVDKNDIKPFAVFKLVGKDFKFLQQISNNYFYLSGCKRFAKKNNIYLSNLSKLEKIY